MKSFQTLGTNFFEKFFIGILVSLGASLLFAGFIKLGLGISLLGLSLLFTGLVILVGFLGPLALPKK